MRIGITGAAGNLGGLLAQHLLSSTQDHIHLFYHKKPIEQNLCDSERTSIYQIDLAEKQSLYDGIKNIDVLIHFAGVLFKARPENFLPETNVLFFKNLCDVAVSQRVRRIILVSFPHVEGVTTPERPAQGKLDGTPISVHAATRLEEERYLFNNVKAEGIESVSLRVGMVYGRGILMIDAMEWLAKRWLLGIWKEPTWIHLISKPDFLESTKNALIRKNINGIYHIGDDGVQTFQQFLKTAAKMWGSKEPWVMPDWMIDTAALFSEYQSLLFNTASPLTRDFVRIGKVSYYGETERMRAELLEKLLYPTMHEGKILLQQ